MRGEKKISYYEYLHREYQISHAPFQPEMDFYDAIKNGHVTKVKELCKESLLDKKGLGTLSFNPLRNMKYHFTISVAVIARSCIEGGLSLPESYNMSDYYIQQADVMDNLEDLSELHNEMCIAYAKVMKRLVKQNICSKHITRCLDYIYENLHTRITVNKLAEITNLAPTYLSKLFKKETGYSISEYIPFKKLETAKSMLAYSDYSIAEITAALAFPNQSYFTNIFKNYCGLTPKQYRDSNHTAIIR